MNTVEFHKLLRKAVAYYLTDAPEYTSVMDELSSSCEDGQWDMVEEALLEVDEFMAESDAGTLAQKERLAAKRENRPSRYPTCFELDEERYKQIAILEKEYTDRSIKFRQVPDELTRSELSYMADLLAKDVKRQKDARDKRIIQDLLGKVKQLC